MRSFQALTPSRYHSLTILAGSILLALLLGVALISSHFYYGSVPPVNIVVAFITLMMAAGAVYAVLLFLIPRLISQPVTAQPDTPKHGKTAYPRIFVIFMALGILARAIFFGSTPIYEDDWYRYLWDGAVVSAGISPYEITPAEAALTNGFGEAADPAQTTNIQILRDIGATQEYWPERINYPYVTTIYPPLTQAAFLLAHTISPFNLEAWRFVLLLIDMAALAVILALLRQWDRSPFWALLYWWNPLLIVVTFNMAHMDVLLVPFLGLALWLVGRDRPRWSAVALGAATAVKFWPIILAPLLYRRWRTQYGTLIITGLTLCATVSILVLPMFWMFDSSDSGFTAYANTWQRNAFLFPLITQALDGIAGDPDLIGRMISAIVPLSFIVWASMRRHVDTALLPRDIMIAVLLFYLVSPTGYPWYAIWFFMLLPLVPSRGAAIFTITLPIYYLRFFFINSDRGEFFDHVLVPIEFGIPILALGAMLIYNARKRIHVC